MKQHVRRHTAAIVVVAVTVSAPSGGSQPAQNTKIVEIDTLNVRDVVYHLSGGGANSLALIDEINGGVVLIDTKPPGWGSSMIEMIEQVTDFPITTIINTHAHPEHAGSNNEFPDTIQIIAHENSDAAMRRIGLYPTGSPGLPTTTFQNRYSLLDGLDRIELYYFGPAHTDGDIVVVFPEKQSSFGSGYDGIAYVGDLFPGKAVPVIDLKLGGSGVAFPETLATLLASIDGVWRVITGHGPFPMTYAGRGRREQGTNRFFSGFMTWEDLTEYADFTSDLLAFVKTAFSAGQSVDEAVSNLQLPDRYAGYDMTNVRATVTAIYSELAEQ